MFHVMQGISWAAEELLVSQGISSVNGNWTKQCICSFPLNINRTFTDDWYSFSLKCRDKFYFFQNLQYIISNCFRQKLWVEFCLIKFVSSFICLKQIILDLNTKNPMAPKWVLGWKYMCLFQYNVLFLVGMAMWNVRKASVLLNY
jgi:hypothetical protein